MREPLIFRFITENGILLMPLFLTQGCLFQYFCGSFAESRVKRRPWDRVAAVLCLLLWAAGWKWEPEAGMARAAVHIVWMLATTAVLVLGFYRVSRGIASFLVVTFVSISECSMMVAYTVLQLVVKLSGVWVWFVEREYFELDEFLTALELTDSAGFFLYDVFIVILTYVFLRKVVMSFRQKDCEIHRTELLFLLTPGITGLLICLLLRTIMVVTVDNTALRLLYDDYPFLQPVVPVIMLFCMMSVCYGVKLFQDMLLLNRERNSRVILENQIKSMQEHMADTERLYSGIRSMKHDMRNTLLILMRLSAGDGAAGGDGCGEGEKGELEAYLAELNQTLDRLEPRYRTGSIVADTLLNMKYHEVLQKMPELALDAEQLIFPSGLTIQGYDCGVILGNALDNAIEACEILYDQGRRQGLFIRVSSLQRGNQFFMEIENSFDGHVFLQRGKEFPETRKTDKKLHGMGLHHIRETAEKYYGAVEWRASGGVFTLTVMMQNERRVEDEL